MLTKLAEFMETRQPELDMSMFDKDTSNPHYCNTPCCVLGWAAHIFDVPDECDSYDNLAFYLFNIDVYSNTWKFLFSTLWPDDPIEAAGRIRYYLEHGTPKFNVTISYKEYAND